MLYEVITIEATAENHKNSIQEPGNLRFDVLQNTEDPVRFVLYEAYETETAADWMAEPRSGINHTLLYPREEE